MREPPQKYTSLLKGLSKCLHLSTRGGEGRGSKISEKCLHSLCMAPNVNNAGFPIQNVYVAGPCTVYAHTVGALPERFGELSRFRGALAIEEFIRH